MADRFYYCNFGTNTPVNVTEAGSDDAAKAVSVRVTYDAANNSKTAALLALEAIAEAILQDTWPPA